MAKFCTHCGKELAEGSVTCASCGTPVEGEVTKTAPATQNTQATTDTKGKSNGMAIAGFIISLISLILCCGTLSWLSLIFSIIGVVSAGKLLGQGKKMAIAGIIISAIGMILFFVAMFVLPILSVGTLETISDELENEWQNVETYDYDDSDEYDFDYDFDS